MDLAIDLWIEQGLQGVQMLQKFKIAAILKGLFCL
jgi:hypothetical protein